MTQRPAGTTENDRWPKRIFVLLETSAEFESDLTVVDVARRFVGRTLEAWRFERDVAADAVLLTSELVTNAVLHARTGIRVVTTKENCSNRAPDPSILTGRFEARIG